MDVASEVMARSRSIVNLSTMSTIPYDFNMMSSGHLYSDSKCGSLRDHAPNEAN